MWAPGGASGWLGEVLGGTCLWAEEDDTGRTGSKPGGACELVGRLFPILGLWPQALEHAIQKTKDMVNTETKAQRI